MCSPHSALVEDPIKHLPGAVGRILDDYLRRRIRESYAIDERVGTVADAIAHNALGGGKRLRPLCAWIGFLGVLDDQGLAELSSDHDVEQVLPAIASLELLQSCALIHDDIIDASDTRRGRPTIHRAFAADHAQRRLHGSSERFGSAIGILAGDLALIWAEDMLTTSGLSSSQLRRVREPWQHMRHEVIGGQILDITCEAEAAEGTSLPEKVNRYKTAAYTVEQPLLLGAAIAGPYESVRAAYRTYGRNIGCAFQLRDDLLGVFGDSAVTGKPAGDDLCEGKRTVLVATALESLDKTDPAKARRLREGLGNIREPHEIADLAEIIRASGAVEIVERRIEHLCATGIHAVRDLRTGDTLATLAQHATRRLS